MEYLMSQKVGNWCTDMETIVQIQPEWIFELNVKVYIPNVELQYSI